MSVLGNSTLMPPVLDRGRGPVVLFANSAVSDYTLFAPQMRSLEPSFRVIGHNARTLTDRSQGPYSLWDLADDVRALLDELEIEKCVIVGSSMGGYMGLRFALRYPERLQGLALLGSTAVPNTAAEEVAFLEKFVEIEDCATIPLEWAQWCATIVFGERIRAEDPDLVAAWVERWLDYPARAVVDECRCWLDREDLTPWLGEIAQPTLVIHGTEDGAIPIERTRPLATQMPDARLVEVPGRGHFVSLEEPDLVSDELARFLADLGPY